MGLVTRDVEEFLAYIDRTVAEARADASWERTIAHEARRPVPREPGAKAGPVDRAVTAAFVGDHEAVLFFRGVRAWVRAGKPVA